MEMLRSDKCVCGISPILEYSSDGIDQQRDNRNEQRDGIMSILFFFFFQAEDGIRDLTVTGVQTCALPICSFCLEIFLVVRIGCGADRHLLDHFQTVPLEPDNLLRVICEEAELPYAEIEKIGRASCRERV